MASLCLFASHYEGAAVPHYIRIYLSELAKDFDRIVLLCETAPDAGSSEFLRERGVEWSEERNEGYDFGKWFQAFLKIDISAYDTVCLINDSCILFSPLDNFWAWSRTQEAEVLGMTHSTFRGPHIQSYFMLLRGPAVAVALRHFAETGLVKAYEDVITKYELGLSARFARNGLRLASFVDNGGYEGEFAPYYKCVEHHIREGIPLIKKRILFCDYRKPELYTLARMNFRLSPARYVRLIKMVHPNLLIDPEQLVVSSQNSMSPWQRFRYETKRWFFNAGRPVYRILKGLLHKTSALSQFT